mgnify:CR=1 FL=1
MIRLAYASLYHWSVIGEPINEQRGEWMVSHVWAVLGRGDPALYHAEKCWKLTEELGLAGFDLAYAREALARANAATGNDAEALKQFEEAEKAAEKIPGDEDRKLFLADLEKGPWFGIR